jgi:hypothetical protein
VPEKTRIGAGGSVKASGLGNVPIGEHDGPPHSIRPDFGRPDVVDDCQYASDPGRVLSHRLASETSSPPYLAFQL